LGHDAGGEHNPPTGPQSRGVDAVNISLAHGTEFSRFPSFFLSSTFPPNGFNWANWSNPEFDALSRQDREIERPGRDRRRYSQGARGDRR
jgi:hypothetical protein